MAGNEWLSWVSPPPHVHAAPPVCMMLLPLQVAGALDFMKHTYGVFGFDFELDLSTRPKKALGSVEVWDNAELMMTEALNAFGRWGWGGRYYSRVYGAPRQMGGKIITPCLSSPPSHLPQTMEDQPRRRRLLRPQDRHQGVRRAGPAAPVRHHPARLPAARAVQPAVSGGRGAQGAGRRHDQRACRRRAGGGGGGGHHRCHAWGARGAGCACCSRRGGRPPRPLARPRRRGAHPPHHSQRRQRRD